MRAHGFARGLGLGVLFAGAYCGTCWLAGLVLPFPAIPEVSEKRAHLRAEGDQYDAIFLGSSRVELQIVPAVFDRRMAELGSPLRSFNAGISAMTPPEDAFFFDEIARAPHRRLRWVFIELGPVRLESDHWRGGSERMAYWHDAERTSILWRAFAADWRKVQKHLASKNQRRQPWAARLSDRLAPLSSLRGHLALFLRREIHLGRGAALAAQLVTVGPHPPLAAVADQGWVGMDDSMAEKNRAEYERTHVARLKTPQQPKAGNPAGAFALRRLVEKVTALGATPVLLIPPTTGSTHFDAPPDLRASCLILDFSDVHAYPELFRLEHRLDVEHLNSAAAPLYSRLLAEGFFANARPHLSN